MPNIFFMARPPFRNILFTYFIKARDDVLLRGERDEAEESYREAETWRALVK